MCPLQLNVNMDYNAKQTLWNLQPMQPTRGQAFSLEPVYILAGSDKITADMGHRVRFLAHRTLSKAVFHSLKILDPTAFNNVDWEMVHQTLHEVPRLFRQWACKRSWALQALWNGTKVWNKSAQVASRSGICAHTFSSVNMQGKWRPCTAQWTCWKPGWRTLVLTPISLTA